MTGVVDQEKVCWSRAAQSLRDLGQDFVMGLIQELINLEPAAPGITQQTGKRR
jgi:hypothetical protein